MEFIIRLEREKDYRIVEELTREAFWNVYRCGCDEHLVVHKLRNSSAFVPELDFVALKDNQIVGNIMYSHSYIKDNEGNKTNVITFGPISVLPEFQSQGIGKTLINHSIHKAVELGYAAVVICGNPNYYSRFGFRSGKKFNISTSDGKFIDQLMVLVLTENAFEGVCGCLITDDVYNIDEIELVQFEKSFPYKEKCEPRHK